MSPRIIQPISDAPSIWKGAFELLGCYEASLRRQLRQTPFTLGRILWRPTARNFSECNLLGIEQFQSLLMMIQ